MGWIEKVKNIIGGLRASGKSEQEIENIVQQAAGKATVVTPEEMDDTVAGTFAKDAKDAVDAMCYAMQALQQQRGSRQQTNNWRKMHSLPMRRKGKR